MKTNQFSLLPTKKEFYKNLVKWWALLSLIATVIQRIIVVGPLSIQGNIKLFFLSLSIGIIIGLTSEVLSRRKRIQKIQRERK